MAYISASTSIYRYIEFFQDDSDGMHPIISLESNVTIERTVAVPVDEISIAPSIREVRHLLGISNLIQMTM